jgi:hypothetical protein
VSGLFNDLSGFIVGMDYRDLFPPPICEFIHQLATEDRLTNKDLFCAAKRLPSKGRALIWRSSRGLSLFWSRSREWAAPSTA